MSHSILSDEKVCFVCETPLNLHKHHIFFGVGNRSRSEEEGCWVYLCDRHHNMTDEGVHFNLSFDRVLKKFCQYKWEEVKGDREQFIKTFGKSYL